MVIAGDPFELLQATDAASFRDGLNDRFVTSGLNIFQRGAFETPGGVQEDISPTSFRRISGQIPPNLPLSVRCNKKLTYLLDLELSD
jgi:hypothetical protein